MQLAVKTVLQPHGAGRQHGIEEVNATGTVQNPPDTTQQNENNHPQRSACMQETAGAQRAALAPAASKKTQLRRSQQKRKAVENEQAFVKRKLQELAAFNQQPNQPEAVHPATPLDGFDERVEGLVMLGSPPSSVPHLVPPHSMHFQNSNLIGAVHQNTNSVPSQCEYAHPYPPPRFVPGAATMPPPLDGSPMEPKHHIGQRVKVNLACEKSLWPLFVFNPHGRQAPEAPLKTPAATTPSAHPPSYTPDASSAFDFL